MVFTLSTKPLVNATNLVIINSNVDKYDGKTTVVELTATKTALYLNTVSKQILSEVKLLGVSDTEEEASIYVDALMFKSLISTIKAAQVELEFTDDALTITAGKSIFTIPKTGSSDGQLSKPEEFATTDSAFAEPLNLPKWKLVKNHQLYAKAENYTKPVYTYVWVGSGNVLVGDLDKGLFTHSTECQLDMTCLLSESIINLITSLPENAKILKKETSCIIYVSADSYEYRSQIIPVFESDDNGYYMSDTILGIFDTDMPVKVSATDILTALNQASLLTMEKEPTVNITISTNHINIKDRRVNIGIDAQGTVDTPYTLTYKLSRLKDLVAKCPDPQLTICPRLVGDEVAGIVIHTEGYDAIASAAED